MTENPKPKNPASTHVLEDEEIEELDLLTLTSVIRDASELPEPEPLDDEAPADIDDDEPLFGGRLGLDSIDALEIVYQVEQNFGVPMKEMNDARPAFASINTLAAFIDARLKA